MRNRKDSVGAKAAAWVGITLGAVVFFTGAAGVLLMDQAGVYRASSSLQRVIRVLQISMPSGRWITV